MSEISVQLPKFLPPGLRQGFIGSLLGCGNRQRDAEAATV
jgi:hypothetical protein